MEKHLIPPHGGTLVNLLVDAQRAAELKMASKEWVSWDLTPRQMCDLELLLNGGFSPLQGFMGRADYESVCASMRLADGTIWPIPIIFDVPEEFAQKLAVNQTIALRDPEGDGRGSRRAAGGTEHDAPPEARLSVRAVVAAPIRCHGACAAGERPNAVRMIPPRGNLIRTFHGDGIRRIREPPADAEGARHGGPAESDPNLRRAVLRLDCQPSGRGPRRRWR